MPRIFAALIRHGDYHQLENTPSAHQPFGLTTGGELQAKEAASLLRELIETNNWTLDNEFHSSTLLRAWQTAKIIADELNSAPYSINQSSSLTERCVGSAANLSIEDIESIIEADPRFNKLPHDWKSNSHFRLPLEGAESLMDAGKRVASYLERVCQTRNEQTNDDRLVIFVGHGAAIRHAAHILNVLEFDQIAKLSMYHAKPVVIERVTKGKWTHVAGNWKIRKKQTNYTD